MEAKPWFMQGLWISLLVPLSTSKVVIRVVIRVRVSQRWVYLAVHFMSKDPN